MDLLESHVRFFLLHWVRCAAMVGPLPLFGPGGAARVAKIALGVMLGSILAVQAGGGPSEGGFAPIPSFDDPGFGGMLVLCLVNELLLGSMFGFVANVAFATIRIAGDLIGTEMGFNMASIQDPITGVSVQVIAHVFESVGILLFIAVGGDHTLIRALAASFERQRVGALSFDVGLIEALLTYTAGVFAAGFQLAAPVFVAMILLGIALAILAKVAPQLQLMQFAFGAKILVGLLLLVATFHVIVPSMASAFDRCEEFLVDVTAPEPEAH